MIAAVFRDGKMTFGPMVDCYRASTGPENDPRTVSTVGENEHEAFWHLVRRLRMRAREQHA